MQTKRSKLSVFWTGIALFATAAMYAQGGSSDQAAPGDMPGNAAHGDRPKPPSPVIVIDYLGRIMQAASVPLSDAQKVAVLGVLEDQEAAMRAQAMGNDRAAVESQMRALRQSSQGSIRTILIEAQARVFHAMRPPTMPSHDRNADSAPAKHDPALDGSAPVDDSNLIDANTGGAAPSEAR